MNAVERRFWALARRPADGCWEWGGFLFKGSGYGGFNFAGKTRRAHRVAFEFAAGRPIKDGLVVMHTCDNRRCVNPKHLREGTFKENTCDMVDKGRSKCIGKAGSANLKAKLTSDQVLEIRALYAGGWYTQAELAEIYGLRRNSMSSILRYDTWK